MCLFPVTLVAYFEEFRFQEPVIFWRHDLLHYLVDHSVQGHIWWCFRHILHRSGRLHFFQYAAYKSTAENRVVDEEGDPVSFASARAALGYSMAESLDLLGANYGHQVSQLSAISVLAFREGLQSSSDWYTPDTCNRYWEEGSQTTFPMSAMIASFFPIYSPNKDADVYSVM